MKKTLLLVLLVFTNIICYTQQLPINHQPVIWLNADKAGNTNNRWDDISGSQYHAYTATGQSLPNQGWFNYNKCFVFDSNSQALRINYMPGTIALYL